MEIVSTDISGLEAYIEDLSAQIGRSQKLMLAGKVGAAVGGLILLSLVTGPFRFGALGFVLGLSLILGGLVLSGSSKRTTDDLRGTLEKAERRRTDAIDGLALRPVAGDGALRITRDPGGRPS